MNEDQINDLYNEWLDELGFGEPEWTEFVEWLYSEQSVEFGDEETLRQILGVVGATDADIDDAVTYAVDNGIIIDVEVDGDDEGDEDDEPNEET